MRATSRRCPSAIESQCARLRQHSFVDGDGLGRESPSSARRRARGDHWRNSVHRASPVHLSRHRTRSIPSDPRCPGTAPAVSKPPDGRWRWQKSRCPRRPGCRRRSPMCCKGRATGRVRLTPPWRAVLMFTPSRALSPQARMKEGMVSMHSSRIIGLRRRAAHEQAFLVRVAGLLDVDAVEVADPPGRRGARHGRSSRGSRPRQRSDPV